MVSHPKVAWNGHGKSVAEDTVPGLPTVHSSDDVEDYMRTRVNSVLAVVPTDGSKSTSTHSSNGHKRYSKFSLLGTDTISTLGTHYGGRSPHHHEDGHRVRSSFRSSPGAAPTIGVSHSSITSVSSPPRRFSSYTGGDSSVGTHSLKVTSAISGQQLHPVASSTASKQSSIGSAYLKAFALNGRSNSRLWKSQITDVMARDDEETIPVESWSVSFARRVVDSWWFLTLTTSITLYALLGDDLRLLATNKPADFAFDVITVTCILIFTVEILLSCASKPDYFGGFFFVLDIVSTLTLLLDLTVINDAIQYGHDEGDLKASRTARIGARSTRIIRVLRLVRIMKLYKFLMSVRKSRRGFQGTDLDRVGSRSSTLGGDLGDDFDDEEPSLFDMQDELSKETVVGKKLSELTTRRCVMIILSMVLATPFLSLDKSEMLPNSGSFGAGIVTEMFEDMMLDTGPRWRYENALFMLVYFHTWFGSVDSCPVTRSCPADYYQHLYWVGVSARNENSLGAKAAQAQVNASVVEAWEERVNQQTDTNLFVYGSMSASVRDALGSSWDLRCPIQSGPSAGQLRLGISFLLQRDSYAVKCPEDLRRTERSFQPARLRTQADHDDFHFAFYYDNRIAVQEDARMNLWTTTFICLLLFVASAMVARDTQELAVNPIEAMMFKVLLLRSNPFLAARLTDEEFRKADSKNNRIIRRRKANCNRFSFRSLATKILTKLMCASRKAERAPLETAVLDNTLSKLGALLTIGFGTAGMSIIRGNMSGKDTVNINAMVCGKTVHSIIGHVRISQFSTFTEVLSNKVMTFVNQVSEIIHGVCDAHAGAPNGFNGDLFLLIWHVLDDETMCLDSSVADLAVLGSTLVLAGVHRSEKLVSYRMHPGLQQRLGANCMVDVTIGLHFGWAIEGALGSEYKFDPSYVSPNVEISRNLERAAELYGTRLLLTEAVHGLLTPAMATKCRLIDKVRIRGSKNDMELFTIDAACTALEPEQPFVGLRWNPRNRYKARQFLEAEKQRRRGSDAAELFNDHPDVQVMRAPYTEAFNETFSMAYQNYSQGEWDTARMFFQQANDHLGFTDGPSWTLLRYMKTFDYTAPQWWKPPGVHALEDLPPPTYLHHPKFKKKQKRDGTTTDRTRKSKVSGQGLEEGFIMPRYVAVKPATPRDSKSLSERSCLFDSGESSTDVGDSDLMDENLLNVPRWPIHK